MIFSRWNAILLFLVLASSLSAESTPAKNSPSPGHRIHRSIPPPGAKTHMVIPGERFRASGFKRWFYGSNYRDLWTTPIEVAVLDLDSVGGGLTPLRTGGAGQSISLHFTGEDGRRYTVRSLDKDPTKRIWDELKDTIVDDLLQDLITNLLPTGALVVDPLMEATGILHSRHTLVVIPDDPKLGEYREEFAGSISDIERILSFRNILLPSARLSIFSKVSIVLSPLFPTPETFTNLCATSTRESTLSTPESR